MFNLFKKKKNQDIELYKALATGFAEGQNRSKIKSAMMVKNINSSEENIDYYIADISVKFICKIINDAGADFKNLDNDQIILTGIFLYVFCNQLSYMLAGSFEISAFKSCLRIILLNKSNEDLEIHHQLFSEISNYYNYLIENDDYTKIIGGAFVEWLNTPSESNYSKLKDLYNLLMNILSKEI
jgi:uncharacterized protein YfkK (UPF0435 family)